MSLFVRSAGPAHRSAELPDQVSGMQACMAVLARSTSANARKGARVEVTMVEASMAADPDAFTAYTQAGHVMQPESRARPCRFRSRSLAPTAGFSRSTFLDGEIWRAPARGDRPAGHRRGRALRERMGRIKNYEALVQTCGRYFRSETARRTGRSGPALVRPRGSRRIRSPGGDRRTEVKHSAYPSHAPSRETHRRCAGAARIAGEPSLIRLRSRRSANTRTRVCASSARGRDRELRTAGGSERSDHDFSFTEDAAHDARVPCAR